jgi:hypothetical protein
MARVWIRFDPDYQCAKKQPVLSESFRPKKSSRTIEDELSREYDFSALRVADRGPGRKAPSEGTVSLAPDVAEAFPNSDSVNEALRLLIRIAKSQTTAGDRST